MRARHVPTTPSACLHARPAVQQQCSLLACQLCPSSAPLRAPECRQLVECRPEGLLQLLRLGHFSSVVGCAS